MNLKHGILIILLFLFFLFLVVAYFTEWQYSKKIINTEPLILSDNQRLEIIDAKYIQRNDIILSDNAELIVRDSYFSHEGHGAQAYTLKANDSSKVIFENSILRTSSWIDWDFGGNSQIIYNNTNKNSGNPWHGLFENATAYVYNTNFGGTAISDSPKFIIRNSHELALELYVYENSTINESHLVPGYVDKFVFPNEREKNINYLIDIEDSNIIHWGIGIAPRGKVYLSDSRDVNFCMPILWPYINETFYFNNLRKGVVYEKRVIEYGGTEIYLENVSSRGWCFNVWDDNTLYVKNSDIDDINHNGGNGRQFYENIVSNVVIANENNYFEIKNSKIRGDVIAKGNSTIVLINTEVKGKIIEKDNGRIFIKD
jgi:hypothetical protein